MKENQTKLLTKLIFLVPGRLNKGLVRLVALVQEMRRSAVDGNAGALSGLKSEVTIMNHYPCAHICSMYKIFTYIWAMTLYS